MSANKFLAGIASRFISIAGKKMHYLDEGQGPVILFVHGIPEWSASYVEVIKILSKQCRCVVPDHLGFGLSEKDTRINLTPKAHAERLLAFIHALQLEHINLVVHDYGGPIGLGALVQEPSLFASVSISNTWLWSLQGSAAEKPLKLFQGKLGKWLYLRYGFSVKVMAKSAFADKKVYQQKAKDMFLSVHGTEEERYANYQLMLEMLRSSAYFDSSLEKLKQLPVKGELVWGMKDKAFSAGVYLTRWKKEFPQFAVREISNAGHFPQLETAEEFADNLNKFIAES